jgi:flagellar motor switch protein FliN/FliY
MSEEELTADVVAETETTEPFEELADVDSARSGIVDMAAQAVPASVQVAELPLATLYDLALPISIELGRTSMTVQEVLQLGRGSVIELDRLAGEPVDIFVGDRRFAEGEVVVLGENFGVRITRILPNGGAPETA